MVKYFISHSIKDKFFVEKFINLLILGGSVTDTEVFCTSRSGDDIVLGKDFVKDIGDNLKEASTVFCFFSSRYLDSTFCMAELGAAWILNKDIVPIIISDLSFNETTPFCRNLQGIKIDDEEGIHSLADKIKVNHKNFKVAAWNKQEKNFVSEIQELLKQKISPNKVGYQQYEEAQQKIYSLKKENKELNDEIEQQNGIIDKLEQCKDKVEVAKIKRENSSQIEQFDDLSEEIESKINNLPDIVREMCFRLFARESMYCRELGNFSGTQKSFQSKMIEEHGDTVSLNTNKRKISEAIELLNRMENMIEEADDVLYEYILEKFDGDEPSMKDKDFWQDCLNVHI